MDIALLLRRAAGGDGDSGGARRGSSATAVMRCRSRSGSAMVSVRGACSSKVSTMIILPPQQAHGREGKMFRRGRPASARARPWCGEHKLADALDVVRARTVPANRP